MAVRIKKKTLIQKTLEKLVLYKSDHFQGFVARAENLIDSIKCPSVHSSAVLFSQGVSEGKGIGENYGR